MRDFGMLVYRSVKKDKRDKKEDDDSDKKKKKEKKLSFSPLLLAYCYFDLSHCNYIASKDLEDLFLTLGLQLSRAQVTKSNCLDLTAIYLNILIFIRFASYFKKWSQKTRFAIENWWKGPFRQPRTKRNQTFQRLSVCKFYP